MVSPIILIAAALGFAFLYLLIEKISKSFAALTGIAVMACFAMVGVSWIVHLVNGGAFIEVQTAGFIAPLSINLMVGISEALIITLVNFLGFLALIYQTFVAENRWKGRQVVLFFVMILGANGLILTRDLFNIFVFMEITSISLFGLLSTSRDRRCYEAGFKYMIAGGLASAFYLIGVAFLYQKTGTLNLDSMLEAPVGVFAGISGLLAMVLFVTAIVIELKPALANGWALDTYEASDPGLAALLSSIITTAMVMVFMKALTLVEVASPSLVSVIGIIGGAGFVISALMALNQTSLKRMLGLSSVSQTALILMVLVVAPATVVTIPGLSGLSSSSVVILSALIILANHALAKSALFWVAGILGLRDAKSPSIPLTIKSRRRYLIIIGIAVFALIGLPPFPAFWVKWNVLSSLVGDAKWIPAVTMLVGTFLEAAYLFRWFLSVVRSSEDSADVLSEEVPDDFEEVKESLADKKEVVTSAFANKIQALSFLIPTVALTLLSSAGLIMAYLWGLSIFVLAPLAALLGFSILDMIRIPQKIQVFLAIGALLGFGSIIFFAPVNFAGIAQIFGLMFIGGTIVQLIAYFSKKGRGDGTVALVVALAVSLTALVLSESKLEFFFSWEMMTITSFLLVIKGRKAAAGGLRFILFSLFSAYCLLLALQMIPQVDSIWQLAESFRGAPIMATVLIAIAAAIKLGAIGFHLWLPPAYAEAPDEVSTLFSSVLSKSGLFLLFLFAGILAVPLIPSLNGSALAGVKMSSLLGWLGALTAFAGAMMALFQEDIKYTLAYSSMSQIGYMILAMSLMTHLGYVASLYLAVTHLMIKGMLWLAILGVIQRTGTRLMYKMGGLIKTMPISFIVVLFGIIAVSGVPPLSGFGGKWLLYTALLEQGWFLQAAIAMFSGGVAFLYLYRLIHSIFLGQPKDELRQVKEAPLIQLIPQIIFMCGVMAVSMYPNWLLKPLQAAVEPLFESTISWNGYEVISSLGYWNGNAVMYVTMGVFAIPLIALLILNGRKVKSVKQFNIVYAAERPYKPITTHYAFNFFAHYRKALGFLIAPWPTRVLNFFRELITNLGDILRRWNSGNAQTYGFQILILLIFIFLVGRGGL